MIFYTILKSSRWIKRKRKYKYVRLLFFTCGRIRLLWQQMDNLMLYGIKIIKTLVHKKCGTQAGIPVQASCNPSLTYDALSQLCVSNQWLRHAVCTETEFPLRILRRSAGLTLTSLRVLYVCLCATHFVWPGWDSSMQSMAPRLQALQNYNTRYI